ncbi:unnamed protein product, partial [Amoebophrya sp. A25]
TNQVGSSPHQHQQDQNAACSCHLVLETPEEEKVPRVQEEIAPQDFVKVKSRRPVLASFEDHSR